MSALDRVGQLATDNYAKQPNNANNALDPAWFNVFSNIIQQLISTFQACKKSPGSVPGSAANPSFVEKIVLRNVVRNHLGLKAYRQHGGDVIKAVLDTGKVLKEKDIIELYEEND